MKKSVKILSALLALVLVFACGIGATLAYLKKETAPVKNTFVAQDLVLKDSDFVLKEHKVVRDEKTGIHKFDDAMTEVNEVKYERVTPGETLPKDPFVRVKNVENAYLFIEVKDDLADGMSYTMDDSWKAVTSKETNKQLVGPQGGLMFVKELNAEGAKNVNVLPALTEASPYSTYKILAPEEIKVDGATFKPETAAADKNVALSFWAYLTQADNFETYQDSWNTMYPAYLAK